MMKEPGNEQKKPFTLALTSSVKIGEGMSRELNRFQLCVSSHQCLSFDGDERQYTFLQFRQRQVPADPQEGNGREGYVQRLQR